MLVPLPLLAPLIPAGIVTVHAKVVPTLDELNAIVVAVPVQMLVVLGVAIATGDGFTVIV